MSAIRTNSETDWPSEADRELESDQPYEADRTLDYYEKNAMHFSDSTVGADMNEARLRFLEMLANQARKLDFARVEGQDCRLDDESRAGWAISSCGDCGSERAAFSDEEKGYHPPHILDLGCGSGRDTKAFLEAGYRVDAVDGSARLCALASAYTGIRVRQMLFQELSARNTYDGIWACASILHLPKKELAQVLQKISAALKPGGIFYTSFKYGTFEGMRNGRYFTDFTEDTLSRFWQEEGWKLRIRKTWITRDVRPGREEERWINILAERF